MREPLRKVQRPQPLCRVVNSVSLGYLASTLQRRGQPYLVLWVVTHSTPHDCNLQYRGSFAYYFSLPVLQPFSVPVRSKHLPNDPRSVPTRLIHSIFFILSFVPLSCTACRGKYIHRINWEVTLRGGPTSSEEYGEINVRGIQSYSRVNLAVRFIPDCFF